MSSRPGWRPCRRAGPSYSSAASCACGRRGRRTSYGQPFSEVVDEHVDRDAVLGQRVAVAYGHGPVLEGLEVDGDAVRRARLVLAAVAAADGLGLVVVGHEVRLDDLEDLAGRRRQRLLLGERQDGHLDRRQPWMEAQDSALL